MPIPQKEARRVVVEHLAELVAKLGMFEQTTHAVIFSSHAGLGEALAEFLDEPNSHTSSTLSQCIVHVCKAYGITPKRAGS